MLPGQARDPPSRATRDGPGPASWRRLGDLADHDRGITGNLVPDSYLAALALAHGCRVATADRGFARFPGLDWFDPAA